MKNYLILAFFTLACFAAAAQNPSKKISTEIAKNLHIDLKLLPDSIPFYGFAFELEIEKKRGVTRVKSVNINDSLAMLLVKNYDFLKKIDFSSQVKEGKKVSLVIPVVVVTFPSDEDKKFKNIYFKNFSGNVRRLYGIVNPEKTDSTKKTIFPPIIHYPNETIVSPSFPGSTFSGTMMDKEGIFYNIDHGFDMDVKLPDSLAFYTFAIESKVRKDKDSTIVEDIALNDSLGYQVNKGYDYLKSINFAPILGEYDKATLIIPVSLIVFNSSKNMHHQTFSFQNLREQIPKLFKYSKPRRDKENLIYSRPIMCYIDKAVF